MAEPWSYLETQIGELRSSLEEVRQRLARLERQSGPASIETASRARMEEPSEPAPDIPSKTPATVTVGEGLGLTGRVLLILGGGFLLRAITESGAIPTSVGLTAGLLFALLWVYFADRAAGRKRRPSAVAHGVAAVLLGLPLVWETTVRFGFLSPWEAGAVLTAITALLLAVAWRRNLGALRWIAALGGMLAALATLAGTRTAPPFAAYLLFLGIATLWDDLERAASALRWLTALAADVSIALVSVAAVVAPERLPVAVVLPLQLALPLLYVGSVGTLDLRERRPIDAFALIQSTAALLVGIGGSVVVAWERETVAIALGSLLLVFSAVGYLLAFRRIERANRRSFHLFATAGMALLLAGSALFLPTGTLRALLWSGLAAVSAGLAAHFGRISMLFQAAVWTVAAGLAAGMFRLGLHAFAGSEPQTWPSFQAAVGAASLAALLCLVLAGRSALPGPSPPAQAARLACWIVLATGVAIALIYAGIRSLPILVEDAGWLSAFRSGVLVAVAMALASAGRAPRFSEARWLVYPALAATGLKLLVEDLPRGRPATLVLSFVLAGGALLLAPRLLRQSSADDIPAGGIPAGGIPADATGDATETTPEG